jgi:catechol 2,3-dioxygenase-like lactoylglutathione lyase family enzyme
MKFLRVSLEAPAGRLTALAEFYTQELGFAVPARERDRFTCAIGETAVEFISGSDEPFYHFALLVPGDRFGEALKWADARTELLPDPDSGTIVFDFDNWAARACYFHDPASNIVELIAHNGREETGARGEFRPKELVGVSELGLVGDVVTMADRLAGELGLELWDGTVDEPGWLAFVGEPARTLILAPRGRGWLPTAGPPHRIRSTLCSQGSPRASSS